MENKSSKPTSATQPPRPSPRTQPPQLIPSPTQPPQPTPRTQPPQPTPRTQPPQPTPRTQPPQPTPRTQPPQPTPRTQPPQPTPRTQPPQPTPRTQPPRRTQLPQPTPRTQPPHPTPRTQPPQPTLPTQPPYPIPRTQLPLPTPRTQPPRPTLLPVWEEAWSPAAGLQPSKRPHTDPNSGNHDHHGIKTAPVTHHLIPGQSSTHSQSSGQTTATAVSPNSECGSALAHQSRIVEDVINRHTSDLTEAFGNDLKYFSNKFIELGFISGAASADILAASGVGKGDKLLNLLIASCHTSRNKKEWFDKFISVFSCKCAYENLGTHMTKDFQYCESRINSMPQAVHDPYSHPFLEPGIAAFLPHTPHMYTTLPYSDPQSACLEFSFIDYVKAFYRKSEVERSTSVVKWPPTPSKVYINLACIDRHSVSGRSREYDEITKAMVRDGNVDVILDITKGPIDFSEIAKNISIPNSREQATSDDNKSDQRRLILVEGAPGVGKSTFAWEFCRRWERGEIAQQYQLVLLLRLREERISNAKSLEDLIYHPSKDVCQAVCHKLLRSHDFHALIILEGFDELPDICRKSRSIFMDLIAGKLLPLATVLVTSRPWATRRIRLDHRDRIYQHIEILGFTGQQITKYMESILPQDKVSDLKAYFESHPQIRAGMYIPVNSAIVVTVYEEGQASGYAMPTTLTEMYTSLTQTLLLRYMRGHPEYETYFIYLQTFKDLPLPVYAKFCELCRIAYKGTIGNGDEVQLIFRGLPSDFDDLGFMDSVTEYVTRGAVSSHNFLHLTFQEFFAAVHISSMPQAEQVEHFKRHKEGRLKVVLRFLAGLNKWNCFSLEEIANNFFNTPSTREGSRYQMSCDAAVGIDLVQWLFEAQSDDVIEHVLGHRTIEFDLSSGMLPLDYYSLGYFISHSRCQWVLRLGKKIGEDEVRMLAAGAGTRSEPSGRVVELKGQLEGFSSLKVKNPLLSISKECLNMVFTEWKSILHLHQLSLKLPAECDEIAWPDLSALRVLELVISGRNEWKLSTLLPYLSLESLTISPAMYNDGLVCEDCVAIGDHVTATTSLKELHILNKANVMIISDEKGVEAITAALASNQSLPLERLELGCECTFTAAAVDSLAQFITNTTTLQYLSMKYCTFSAHALLVLARAIHHNSILQTKQLVTFYLTVNGDNEAKDLAQLLVEYPDMMKRIYYQIVTGISDAGAVALAQALHHNSTLTGLNLSNNSISDAGAVALAQALHHSSTLTELKLSNNCISDTGAVALAQALHHNSMLEKLYLSNNHIGDDGALALSQAFHPTLKLLDMSNNCIGNAGAVALAQTLHHNSNLTWLDLYGNDGIGEEGTHELVHALTVNKSTELPGLSLPGRCEEYATQCPGYHTVENSLMFF